VKGKGDNLRDKEGEKKKTGTKIEQGAPAGCVELT